ncbi:amino acid adenylation domain-containing protein [Phreatobacter aquaticus]|uniref:Amino acid adenylation domain-containing protein n=1 Tax=Phreatobacter aquaticus TaxID=2570229 RepID=A0A4D7QB08_9HYPH|nr:non-ribosomal peptide synthetase [Phreatobacter aquaticus]QCK84378.1 amino acid adenylation domain-containing protein [Phreatobacter aquaticus]
MSGINDLTVLDSSGLSLAWRDHPVRERGSIGDLVRQAAAVTPGKIALLSDTGRLTYGELVLAASAVHSALQRRGARRGDTVVVLGGRSLHLPALLLGTLDAGCAYVPIAPDLPARFIDSVISAARPRFILVAPGDAARVPHGWQDRVIALDEEAPHLPPVPTGPVDLAYIIFTSGSTGAPKGVAVRHGNVTRLMVAPGYATITAGSVALALSTPTFDASVFDLWPFLANGATVAIHPGETPTPDSIAGAVTRHGVTTAFVTTGLFNRIAEDRPDALRGVEVLTGGERGLAANARRMLEAGARAIVHCYGPTETAVFATAARFTARDAIDDTFPVGGPIAGTACYVLDAERRPVPIGGHGELWIGGEAVAQGYANDDALTAERFLPDPFRPEGRFYRSGDLVVMDEHGALTFLDRLDDQIKIRGHRVEPGAIARALESIAPVRQAIVLASEPAPGERRLHAVVEAPAAPPGFGETLRRRLQDAFPPALVPARIVVVPAFPLAPNGKTDRKALEALLVEQKTEASHWADEGQKRIATLFHAILGLVPQGPDEDFFDLGGDSLLAMRLVRDLRSELGISVALRDLYQDATIAGLAARSVDVLPEFEAGTL